MIVGIDRHERGEPMGDIFIEEGNQNQEYRTNLNDCVRYLRILYCVDPIDPVTATNLRIY